MTDFESATNSCDQQNGIAFPTSSKCVNTSCTSSKVDMSVHVEICLQFFSRLLVLKTVQTENSTRQANTASHNLATIYQEASCLLKDLKASNCLLHLLPAVRFMESNYEASSSSCNSFATSIVQDLILLTSFACSHSLEQNKIARANDSTDSTSSSVTGDSLGSKYEDNTFFRGNQYQSVTAILIALAPYWAIAVLIVQGNKAEESKKALTLALVHFLRTPLAFKACCDLSEDSLERLAFTEQKYLQMVAPSSVLLHHHQLHLLQQQHQESLLMHITNRLRKGLRSHLHHPLLFCLVLSLSLRHDLSRKVRSCMSTVVSKQSQENFENLISQSDANCLDLTELLVTIAPKLVMKADITNQQCTPLIYVTAHRVSSPPTGSNLATLPSLSSESLVLGLVQIITDYVPSALTICDHRGMYPLHYAARRGYSKVLSFLANRFGGFTLALTDHSGKYPLHHALLSHHLHSEDDIVSLASLSPQLLDATGSASMETPATNNVEWGNAFKPLQYARKISFTLYDRLSECLSRWREAEQLQWQSPIHSWRNHRLEQQDAGVDLSRAEKVETIPASTTSSPEAVHSSDESLKSSDEEDEEAVSSLQFFAQSLLMLQRAAGTLEPVSSVPASTPTENSNNSKSQSKRTKRSASEMENPSAKTTKASKKTKRVVLCEAKKNEDAQPSLLAQPEALLDGLTSGESSISSLEAAAVMSPV